MTMTEREPRFAIGTRFNYKTRVCTVTDILRTYNSAGDLVKIRYVAEHKFLGQIVTDSDVCETSIARGRPVTRTVQQ